jgi:uncharacterized protein
MKREFDPGRLDVEAFARDGGTLQGDWPLSALERLASSTHPDVPPQEGDRVRWRCEGELRSVRGAAPQVWLHLQASTALSLQCQRCLGPVPCALDARRDFLFVHGEDTAAELDADSEDDVLALTRALDVQALVEDELLLSLPLVPRHEICPEVLPHSVADPGADDAPPNPFAALAALKGKSQPG